MDLQRMPPNANTHDIAMEPPIAAQRKSMTTSIALSGRRRADKIHAVEAGTSADGRAERMDHREAPLSLEGAADHWNQREDTDYFSQPGAQFRLMSPAQQGVLFENTARSSGDAPREIQLRYIRHCLQAYPAYGEDVARALGIDPGEAG
jgi:catalase